MCYPPLSKHKTHTHIKLNNGLTCAANTLPSNSPILPSSFLISLMMKWHSYFIGSSHTSKSLNKSLDMKRLSLYSLLLTHYLREPDGPCINPMGITISHRDQFEEARVKWYIDCRIYRPSISLRLPCWKTPVSHIGRVWLSTGSLLIIIGAAAERLQNQLGIIL